MGEPLVSQAFRASKEAETLAQNHEWDDASSVHRRAAQLYTRASGQTVDVKARDALQALAKFQARRADDIATRKLIHRQQEIERKERAKMRKEREIERARAQALEAEADTKDIEMLDDGFGDEDIVGPFDRVLGLFETLLNILPVSKPLEKTQSTPHGSEESYYMVSPTGGTTNALQAEIVRLQRFSDDVSRENRQLRATLNRFRKELESQGTSLRMDMAMSMSRMRDSQMLFSVRQSTLTPKVGTGTPLGASDKLERGASLPQQIAKRSDIPDIRVAKLEFELQRATAKIEEQNGTIRKYEQKWAKLKSSARKKKIQDAEKDAGESKGASRRTRQSSSTAEAEQLLLLSQQEKVSSQSKGVTFSAEGDHVTFSAPGNLTFSVPDDPVGDSEFEGSTTLEFTSGLLEGSGLAFASTPATQTPQVAGGASTVNISVVDVDVP